MKKTIAILLTALCASSVMADNEWYHVFRNDNKFNSFDASKVESISFTDKGGVFSAMTFNKADGTSESVSLSAVDSIVLGTSIPVIEVNLVDYPNITELYKSGYDSNGNAFSKSYVYQATLKMNGMGVLKDIAEQTVEFRGRGNSTWNMPKTPYRFKMAKKTAIGDMPKAKSFALIANYIDCTLMRNAIALWTARTLGMPYSNHSVPVKVYLNGNYKGAYMMTEKIGVGGGSVDIDEMKGLLFELDSNYDEDFKFKYQKSTSNGYVTLPIMVKDPDLTEIAEAKLLANAEIPEGETEPIAPTASEINAEANAMFAKWQADFTKMLDAVFTTPTSGSLKDYIDLESLVNFVLVNTLASNHEMKHPKSFYIHKDSIEGVYKFGPVWDFDWAFTFDGQEGAAYNVPMVSSNGDASGYTFWKTICANQEFRTMYKERWDKFVKEDYPALKAFMEEYANTIEPTAKENGLIWPSNRYTSWCVTTSSFDFRKNFETLKTWIDNRIAYCNSHANYGIYQ